MKPRKPNFRWIEENKKRIITPILDKLDEATRAIVEEDLEKIRENPDDPPFQSAAYKGRDFPGSRGVVIAGGRFAVVYVRYADHPVLAVKYFLDADRFDAIDVPPIGP